MKNILMIVLTFFSVQIFAQTQQQTPSDRIQQEKNSGATFETFDLFSTVNNQKLGLEVPSEVKNYTVFDFNDQKMASFTSKAPTSIELQIPGQKSNIEVELVKVAITTDDFEIREMPSGKIIRRDNSALHYRGIVKGESNSIVALSFFDNEISGVISVGNSSGNLVIGKLKNSKHQIIYEDKDIKHLNTFACQMPIQPSKGYTEEQVEDSDQNRAAVSCPRVFFDIGSDIVNDKGGAEGATNYIEAIFNQVSVLYSNDNISIKMSGVQAWTSTQPFSNLDNYGNYRNSNSFNGDLGHFVTYNFSGGIAWVNALCSRNNYAVSGITSSYSNVPTYSWSVMVVAHELGHNLGSQHTQACVWNGNNTAIDGCYTTEGSCAQPALPSDGGTIMSYCHLTSVGINFNKGFGSQPSNVIRNTINSKNCLESCDGGDCSTGDQVTVTFTNNTNCSLEYFENNNSQTTISAGQSDQVATTIGANWVARNSAGEDIDTFSISCTQTTYETSGSCTTDGNPCEGVSEWSSSESYSVGDKVTYQGNLYERTSSGWTNLGPCPTTDPCAGISEWSSSESYSVGDKVTYQGNLYERTSSGWINLGTCGALLPDPVALLTEELSFVAYPNPVKDILTIEVSNLKSEPYQVYIKGINGRTLQTITVEAVPGGKSQKSIDMNNFSAGIYFIQVRTIKGIRTQKVFVQ